MQCQHPQGDGRRRNDIFIYLFIFQMMSQLGRGSKASRAIMGRKTEVQEVRRRFRHNVNGEASKLRKAQLLQTDMASPP